MGNQFAKLNLCFTGGNTRRSNPPAAATTTTTTLPPPIDLDEGLGHSFCYLHSTASAPKSFTSISGAAISANASTPPSTDNPNSNSLERASTFESSDFFSSIPLQPIPRNSTAATSKSGPILNHPSGSGPVERGFLSGPIERSSLLSGPLETTTAIPKPPTTTKWSFSFTRNFKTAFSNPIWGFSREMNSNEIDHSSILLSGNSSTITSQHISSDVTSQTFDDVGNDSFRSQNLQWAQGRAGEDRVHVVISEPQGWIFVGIYDGFNGPDATDFLLQNLYSNVYKELNGVLWTDSSSSSAYTNNAAMTLDSKERAKLDRKLRESLANSATVNHLGVLKALSDALRKTEESYLNICDLMLRENPELCLMGSCVLAMVMKDDDVYLMNVGDSRAVLAHYASDEMSYGFEYHGVPQCNAVQLSVDHSTSIDEEVAWIRNVHADDPCAISKDRVKGSLKVTRAFGAGYLKNPKWNNALLKMFSVDYIGSSPYITCTPSLFHHRLDQNDKFLILSSDGLYQYFTNDDAVAEVESFMSTFPEGDPAQHLVEEVLFRAAKKAGMDFYELLDIPQGERRRYHDDVSVIIISFEGKIWRSSV